MRILRTKVAGQLCQSDIDKIAMELVNMYHGTRYYDSNTGKLLKEPEHGFWSYKRGSCTYTPVTTRCHVYLNDVEKIKINSLICQLTTAFGRLNTWGRRQELYVYNDNYLTTLCAIDSEKSKTLAILVVKPSTRKSVCIADLTVFLETDPRVCQIESKTQELMGTQGMMASVFTVVVDVLHEFPDNWTYWYGSIKMPEEITVIPDPILVDKVSGAELHVWHLASGRKPQDFAELKHETYVAPDLKELSCGNWAQCTQCKTPIWGKFYAVTSPDAKSDPVCRFCVHYTEYNPPAASLMLVAQNTLTAMNAVMGIKCIPADVRPVLKKLIASPPVYRPTGDEFTEFGHFISGDLIGICNLQTLFNYKAILSLLKKGKRTFYRYCMKKY